AGERTAADRVAAARELVESTGKVPILARDVPGFAWNRLQLALIRESVKLVEEGIVAGEQADRVVSAGLARRWRHVGPLATVALGGVETWNEIGRNLTAELSNVAELPDLAAFLPPIADPSGLARRRDEGLMADLGTDFE